MHQNIPPSHERYYNRGETDVKKWVQHKRVITMLEIASLIHLSLYVHNNDLEKCAICHVSATGNRLMKQRQKSLMIVTLIIHDHD